MNGPNPVARRVPHALHHQALIASHQPKLKTVAILGSK